MKKISIQIKGTMKSLIRSRAFLLLEQHGKNLEMQEAIIQLEDTPYSQTVVGFFAEELQNIGAMILEIHSQKRDYNILLAYFIEKQNEKEAIIKELIKKANIIIEDPKIPRITKEVLESGVIFTSTDSTTLEICQDLLADYQNQVEFISDCIKEIRQEKARKIK